jgi:hypothetical protein
LLLYGISDSSSTMGTYHNQRPLRSGVYAEWTTPTPIDSGVLLALNFHLRIFIRLYTSDGASVDPRGLR